MLMKEDFVMIRALVKRGVYQRDIAEHLGVHPKTVSRALAPQGPQQDCDGVTHGQRATSGGSCWTGQGRSASGRTTAPRVSMLDTASTGPWMAPLRPQSVANHVAGRRRRRHPHGPQAPPGGVPDTTTRRVLDPMEWLGDAVVRTGRGGPGSSPREPERNFQSIGRVN